MSAQPQPVPPRRWPIVLGWIISLLPAAALAISAYFKIFPLPEFVANFDRLGWTESSNVGLAIVELGCLALYLFPRTAVLGAILLTGYLGGAVTTHVRVGDPFVLPILFGVFLWLGLLLRCGRVRAIVPWRGNPSAPGGFMAGFAKTLLTIAVIGGVVAALIAAQPAAYRITRSITIAAPASQIFPHVNDFHQWAAWSPWLDDDQEAKVTIAGPSQGKGAFYTWSGNDKVGEGKMTITESVPNERVKTHLEFIRPRPGNPDADFVFKKDGDKTIVTWTLAGERDFVDKAFASFLPMDQIIGSYFDKGLTRLKDVVEKKK